MLMALGQDSKPVTQTEYDVTAYRNVLDQLNTVEGELNKLRGFLRADLGSSLQWSRYKARKKLSGFMMQAEGGKAPYRWHIVVQNRIGLSGVRTNNNSSAYRLNSVELGQWMQKVSGNSNIDRHPGFLPFKNRIGQYIFDVHNLIRNVNWELNRLRIEMPFDLRQLTNQLNSYGSNLQSNTGPDAAIAEYKIFGEIENLRKKIIPTMKERIKKKIKEAKLVEKVAADEMRKENEKTLTDSEREQREMDKVKEQGYKVKKTEDGYVISLKGMNWTTINRDTLRKLSRGNMPDALSQKLQSKSDEPSATATTTSTGSSGGGGGGHVMPAVYEPDKQTQQENEQEMTTAERTESGGGGARGVATAGAILGALALLGQG